MLSIKTTVAALLSAVVLNVGCFSCPVSAAPIDHGHAATVASMDGASYYFQPSCLTPETVSAPSTACPLGEATAQLPSPASFVPTDGGPSIGNGSPYAIFSTVTDDGSPSPTMTSLLTGTVFKRE